MYHSPSDDRLAAAGTKRLLTHPLNVSMIKRRFLVTANRPHRRRPACLEASAASIPLWSAEPPPSPEAASRNDLMVNPETPAPTLRRLILGAGNVWPRRGSRVNYSGVAAVGPAAGTVDRSRRLRAQQRRAACDLAGLGRGRAFGASGRAVCARRGRRRAAADRAPTRGGTYHGVWRRTRSSGDNPCIARVGTAHGG